MLFNLLAGPVGTMLRSRSGPSSRQLAAATLPLIEKVQVSSVALDAAARCQLEVDEAVYCVVLLVTHVGVER